MPSWIFLFLLSLNKTVVWWCQRHCSSVRCLIVKGIWLVRYNEGASPISRNPCASHTYCTNDTKPTGLLYQKWSELDIWYYNASRNNTALYSHHIVHHVWKSHHASQGEQCGLDLRHVPVLKQVISFKYVIWLHAICKNGLDEVAQVLKLCEQQKKKKKKEKRWFGAMLLHTKLVLLQDLLRS